MLVIEATGCLLWLLESGESAAIDKLADGVDWLVFGLSLVGNILASHKVDLERIQLPSEEWVEQWLVSCHSDVQVKELNGL